MYNIEDTIETSRSSSPKSKSITSDSIIFNPLIEKHKQEMYSYDYEKLHRDLKHFKALFSTLSSLENGDKLSFENECFYVSKSSLFQGVERWYYSQNRKDVFDHLLQKYGEYKEYIEKICLITRQNLENKCMIIGNPQDSFTYIPNHVIDLNKILIDACLALQQTYLDDTELSGKFMLMSNFLIFFNTKLQAAMQEIDIQ